MPEHYAPFNNPTRNKPVLLRPIIKSEKTGTEFMLQPVATGF